MSEKFLTIKEASDLSGKAEITIRRLIKYLSSQKDNLSSQTTTQKYGLSSQMISQMIRQERLNDHPQSPFIYKINQDLIMRVFDLSSQMSSQVSTQKDKDDYADDQVGADHLSSQENSQGSSNAFNEVVALLKEQLKTKDGQIKDMSNQINQLIERDRETNILIGRLQERVFQLEAPREARVGNEYRDATEKPPEGTTSDLAGAGDAVAA